MSHQLGTTLRTSMGIQLVNALASGTLKLFSGSVPADCAAADPAGLLASGSLPATAASVSSGVVTKSGTWSFTGSGAGTIASFRLYDSGAVCIHQGTVTLTAGGGDMTLDNTNIATGQTGSVGTYSITMPGA